MQCQQRLRINGQFDEPPVVVPIQLGPRRVMRSEYVEENDDFQEPPRRGLGAGTWLLLIGGLALISFMALTSILLVWSWQRHLEQIEEQIRGPADAGANVLPGQPLPPLQLEAPPPWPARVDGQDLTAMDSIELWDLAENALLQQKDYTRAGSYFYWYVQKKGAGQYNLACCHALLGQVDAAFYWMQEAAIREGGDAKHAEKDEDLASLRADPRWGRLFPYLEEFDQFWEKRRGRTRYAVPRGYRKGTPIPAVLYLHGFGSAPDEFVNDDVQRHANTLQMAIIGVCATLPRGPNSFEWLGDSDLDRDIRHVRTALAELRDYLTIQEGRIVTCGFSDGAQFALELAVRHPDEFAGAIVLSPRPKFTLSDVTPVPTLKHRGFVLTCGGKEGADVLDRTTANAAWLQETQAKLLRPEYPDASLPPLAEGFSGAVSGVGAVGFGGEGEGVKE